MKKIGSEFELKEERARELLRIYRQHIMAEGEVRLEDAIRKTIHTPCSRFWVSEYRALLVVRKMLEGDCLASMGEQKRLMYEEIYCRFIRLQQQHPDWTDRELVSVVIKQPAPGFYLTVGSAIVIIHRIKKEWRRRQGF